MLRYLVRRVLGAVPVLLVASFITFWLIREATDPLAKFRRLKNAKQILAEQSAKLGLDDPIIVQWWHWLTKFLRGDWGTSSRTGDSVSEMIRHALWPTIQLLFWATLCSVIIALALGTYSSVKQYSTGDYAATGLSYVGIAMPDFWFALIAIGLLVTRPTQWFGLDEPIFYSIGLHSEGMSGFNVDYLRHLFIPVLVLTFTSVAAWSRFHRSAMLDTLNADYVRTARAKGVPQRQVITKHAFRNALIPFVTVTVLDTAFLIGGVIIVEKIFSIPGMGSAYINAFQAGDANFLLAWFFVVAIAVVLMNLLADVFYVVLDPADQALVSTPEFEVMLAQGPMDPDLAGGHEPVARSNWQLFRRRFLRHKLGLIAIAVLVILMIACFGAPWLAPYKQGAQNFLESGEGPSSKHWFGTDDLGRDQLTEIMYAGRISLMIGLVVALLSTVVGVTIGATAAYFGKATDGALSALTNLFLILPDLALLAIAISILGQNASSIIVVLAFLSWMYVARIVRAQVLSLKEKEFVEAARASGASATRVLIRHIVPNCTGVIMVNATLAIAAAVSTEAALSFLGFGVQPPQNSWGRMLNDAKGYATSTEKWYLVFFPGMMLLLTVLAVNFLGDALRDANDPKARR